MEKYNEATMKKHLGDTQANYTDKINKAEKVLFDNTDELNNAIIALPGSTMPVASDGKAGSAGTAGTLSRSDHKHPSDASKLNVEPIAGTPLLDPAKKINTYYLPDSILGQVRYCGTWDASSNDATNVTFSEQAKPTEESIWVPRAGDYFICTKAGKYSPSGFGIKAIAIVGDDKYQPGDWALINSVSLDNADTVPYWGKIDNTDAVRTVNNRIGDVNTYQGDWLASIQYRVGDFVQKDNVLYICIKDALGDTVQPTQDITNQYWKPCGSVTSVNGQTGEVNIWRDLHDKTKKYNAGDLVREDKTSDIYICLKDTAENIELTNKEHWRITGKVYTNAQAPIDGKPGNAGLMSILDKSNLDENTKARHTHTNKALLDTYTQTNLNIKDAVDKKHSHSNKTVLDDTTASYTTEEKDKLAAIDDSLKNVTADQIGKVKDVKVNGTSVLGTDGVAAITLEALAAEYVTVTSTDSSWVDKTIKDASGSNVTYKAIAVQKTDTALCVFNSAGQEIIVQKIYDSDYLYLCVGASTISCTIRKLKGNSTGTGGSGGGSGSGDVTAAGNNTFTGSNSFEQIVTFAQGITNRSHMTIAPMGSADPTDPAPYAIYGHSVISLKDSGVTGSDKVHHLTLPTKTGTFALTSDIPTVTHRYLHHLYITGSDEGGVSFDIYAQYINDSETFINTFDKLLSEVKAREMMATGYCGTTDSLSTVYCLKPASNSNLIHIASFTSSQSTGYDIGPLAFRNGLIFDTPFLI